MSRKTQPAQRDPLDRYYTPSWATAILLDRVPEIRGATLLDPCCGDGTMADIVVSRFDSVFLNDVDPDAPAAWNHRDARHRGLWEGTPFDWCVTNPPFAHAGQMEQHALDHARIGVALFLRLSFLEVCQGREFLVAEPPQRVISLPRIRFRGQGTDKVSCAWLVWSRERLSGPPIECVARSEAMRVHTQLTAPAETKRRAA